MRQKKRYMLFDSLPKQLPEGAEFLFQNNSGYVIKADLRTAHQIKQNCSLVSGSIRRLKHPKLLNRRKTER